MTDRSRRLNKRLDDLFPVRKYARLTCPDCEFERKYTEVTNAWHIHRYLTEGCPDCGADLGELDIRRERGCRVCGEPPAPSRKVYCSGRCSDIASAVQQMFVWTTVRKQILTRDDETCQNPACPTEDADELHVDHIRRVSEDGHPFDERNLITLCETCHTAKTHGTAEITTEDAPGLALEGREKTTLGDYLETDG